MTADGGNGYARPLAGLTLVLTLLAITALAVTSFRGDFADTVPVTVLTKRAGLVMNPDAKVKMYGVQVGSVSSIEDRPDGQAALTLAMDPDKLFAIPSNVNVDISSATVFGAKSVQLSAPSDPDPVSMKPGQVLDAQHVTVELNTVFQQLTTLFSHIQPEKLNETVGALATALHGRGAQFGQTLTDLDAALAEIEPSLPALRTDLAVAPAVVNSYADASDDLLRIASNSSEISRTLVQEQNGLDALLLASTGLAQIGNEVVGDNRAALTDVLHLLTPTTALTAEYGPALTCGLKGLASIYDNPSPGTPGLEFAVNFLLGADRYRYPKNLPKNGGSGGPQCSMLPKVPFEARVPFVVTDIGANPFERGNQGIVLNSDSLKRLLFGPQDGPPRNSAQVGQPG